MRKLIVVAVAATLFGDLSQAASVINGSMTDTGGDYNVFNLLVPTGWDNDSTTFGSLNSPDIFDENTDFGGFTWDASSDGGTFVHALAFSASDEGIAQTITDLIIGQTYVISFEQSISSRGNAQVGNAGVFDVTFGDTTLTSATMTTPSAGVPFGWEQQSLMFTATATTQELIFLADQASGNDSIRVDLGLDGVSLAVIPIPAVAFLFPSGLLAGLAWIRARQTKSAVRR